MVDSTRHLPASAREQLSDTRLLLDTAAHNTQVALKNTDYHEALIALDIALAMTEQALAALRRTRAALKT
jgi:hypothetical protein